jgi:hypothetical protein
LAQFRRVSRLDVCEEKLNVVAVSLFITSV